MTAKLILSLNGIVLKECPLDKERVTIGRKTFNDITIDNLAVSGEHAVVETLSNDSFLEDLGSTNGVIVNGAEIKKHFLQHNDVIEIGRHKLVYINEQQTPAVDNFTKTVLVRPTGKQTSQETGVREKTEKSLSAFSVQDQKNTQSWSRSQPAIVPSPPPAPTTMIQILTGPNAGKELTLVKSLTTLGKPGVQVAVITRRPHGFFITHVEGAKFPLLNGQALNDQPHLLQDHDVIELAGIKMEFYLK